MKRIFLQLSVVIISLTASYSQIYIGAGGALNSSTVHFDDDSYNQTFKYIGKTKFGFNAGINGYFYFSKVLDLKVEMQYLTKGFKYSGTYSYGQKTFNYGQVNLMGQMEFNHDADVVIAPYLGAYIGYWISGTRTQTDIKTGVTDEDIIYLKGDTTFSYNRYDSGISAGVDFKFPQANHKYLILGTRYDYGMITTDIDKVAGWKNRTFSLYLQYYFRLKK